MHLITSNGEVVQSDTDGGLTGKELAAVILTRHDDKPELSEVLSANVFPRMIREEPSNKGESDMIQHKVTISMERTSTESIKEAVTEWKLLLTGNINEDNPLQASKFLEELQEQIDKIRSAYGVDKANATAVQRPKGTTFDEQSLLP